VRRQRNKEERKLKSKPTFEPFHQQKKDAMSCGSRSPRISPRL